MINLTLTSDELLLLLGVKEAQIFQHCQSVDKLKSQLTETSNQLIIAQHQLEQVIKDRDMDAIQIHDLETKLSRVKMMAGV